MGAVTEGDPTTVGPAADETDLLPPATEAAPTLMAWSAEPPVDYPVPRPWRLPAAIAAGIVVGASLLAAAVGLTAWALRPSPAVSAPSPYAGFGHIPPAAVAPTMTSDVHAPPPVTVTAMPPSTVTVRPAPPPAPEIPAARSFTDAQERDFIRRLLNSGLSYSDRATIIGGAEGVCSELDNGMSYSGVSAAVAENAPQTSARQRSAYIADAVRALCPDHEGDLP